MSAARALGPFELSAPAAEAEAFRAATDAPELDGLLPLTFPMRWLASPAILDALIAAVDGEDLVFVHESQAFDYIERLRVDVPYVMALNVRRTAEPDRLVADGVIATPPGSIVARFETVLRLIKAPSPATGPHE